MNKSTRVLTLFLCFVLAFSFLVIPANAADINFGLNVFDYIGSHHEYWFSPGMTHSVTYNLPDSIQLSYVDLVILSDTVPQITITVNGQTFPMTVEKLYASYYRVYGAPAGLSSSNIVLNYTVSSDTYLKINKFFVYNQNIDYIPLDYVVNNASYSAGTDFSHTFPTTSTHEVKEAIYLMSVPKYYLYDYVDIELYLNQASLTYVSCAVSGGQIPITVSYVNSSGVPVSETFLFDDGDNTADRSYIFTSFPSGYVTISIDLSSFPAKRDIVPFLSIGINYETPSLGSFTVTNVNGLLLMDSPNPLYYYFSSLKSWLADGFNSIVNQLKLLTGSGSEGDELSEDSAQISSGLEHIDDFEHSQQALLDNNFQAIQNTVSLTRFTAALAFVQRYTNMVFNGFSDYTIVYTLPVFLGLFFYLCSRVPGLTRWKSNSSKERDSS